jgi:tetratricopeptide (TPR) repeat protein
MLRAGHLPVGIVNLRRRDRSLCYQPACDRHLVLRLQIPEHSGERVSEHISRKELKHDRIKETIEHGADAVISHGQFSLIVVVVALVVALGYGGWRFYIDRQSVEASGAFDVGMKAYRGRIAAAPDPAEPNEPFYPDEPARVQDALQKFTKVADKYPGTNPGKLARYYSALCLEDLERHNQALEDLKKISGSSDKELAAMAQYQMALIYSRTGKPDDAVKTFRALADKSSALVPRPLVLLELASVLRTSNPKEATSIYQQIKKEFPDTAISDQADRGLDTLSPKS